MAILFPSKIVGYAVLKRVFFIRNSCFFLENLFLLVGQDVFGRRLIQAFTRASAVLLVCFCTRITVAVLNVCEASDCKVI